MIAGNTVAISLAETVDRVGCASLTGGSVQGCPAR